MTASGGRTRSVIPYLFLPSCTKAKPYGTRQKDLKKKLQRTEDYVAVFNAETFTLELDAAI